ncbi:MAG: pyrroline-5-carboxylate reductase [Planctomycetes bacterium]|nr:pyrroline-5-carboxylate reductase [Planctomycetota bacterium]MCB9905498.1 pyrroline-5-carboxylate reductase [Planctomycetota bacterium]
MDDSKRLAVLGLGTMGRTLVRGLLEAGHDPRKIVGTARRKEAAESAAEELGIEVSLDSASAAASAEVILLCVKPKQLGELLTELADEDALTHDPLLVSIAAGVSTDSIEKAAQRALPIVRAMPNTPCRIREGMTVLSAGRDAGDEHLAYAERLFTPLGRVMRLDEEHMDAVTGLSASGPAFVYVIIEALSEGGVMVGLPRAAATTLAAQMVQGAARMVLGSGKHPAALKDEVTTPAGCTISALLSLEDGKLRSVLARGVQEATIASAGLGQKSAGQYRQPPRSTR